MTQQQLSRHKLLLAADLGTSIFGAVFVNPRVNVERHGTTEGHLTVKTREYGWRDAEVIDMRPFLLKTLLALDAFSSVLPEQVLHDISFVAIADVATVAEVKEFVLPNVARQFALIAALLQAHVASIMLLSQVNHQTKG